MNISRANTIPMKMLDYEHGSLNRLVKVTTASLHYLTQESAVGNAPPLTQLFDTYVPYWGNPPIAEMSDVERDIFIEELGRMSVVRVISALDHYITSISSELDSINSINGIALLGSEEQSNLDNDNPPSFIGFAKQLGLHLTEEQEGLSRFINILRNCCAHRAGHASKKLVELIADSRIAKSLIIKSDEGKKEWIATFPQLNIGDKIPIGPIHAIWASSICLKLAREIDSFIIRKIGVRGLLCSAIYNLPKSYYLGKGIHTFDTPLAAINFLLSQMRVTEFQEVQTVQILRKEMLWDMAVDKFNKTNNKKNQ